MRAKHNGEVEWARRVSSSSTVSLRVVIVETGFVKYRYKYCNSNPFEVYS